MRRRIGIYLNVAHTDRDYLGAVSGHVQIPLKAAAMLRERGHDVTLITTKPRQNAVLPVLSESAVSSIHLPDASRTWPRRRARPVKALSHLWALRRSLQKNAFDAVHFFGFDRTVLLAAGMRAMGAKVPVVATPVGPPGAWLMGPARAELSGRIARLDGFMSLTPWTARAWAEIARRPVPALPPGVLKELPQPEPGARDSVLFWRNASHSNGADLAADAFRALAPRHPEVHFRFAVRPHDTLEPMLQEAALAHPNIHVHVYPYRDGVTLESLLKRSICGVFPFRVLSINPQLSILETLYAGCPVVASDIESNVDIVDDATGVLFPSGSRSGLIHAIETALSRARAQPDWGVDVARLTRRAWNWPGFAVRLAEAYEAQLGLRL